MNGYDNWLTRGCDYGQADWEEWAESYHASDAYAEYCARAKGDDEALSFEDWLDTPEADVAYDDARFNMEQDDYRGDEE